MAPDALPPQGRQICARCSRPARVCLCPALPPHPLPTLGRVIVLQHPHELKKPLATVPLLKQALQGCEIIVGRKLREVLAQGTAPRMAALLQSTQPANPLPMARGAQPQQCAPAAATGAQPRADEASTCSGRAQADEASTAAAAEGGGPHPPPPLYILFPGRDVQPVSDVAVSAQHVGHMHAALRRRQQQQQQRGAAACEQQQHQQQQQPCAPSATQPAYVLLAVDGTWRQGKEMFNALKDVLLPPGGCGLQICLPPRPVPQQQGQQQQQPHTAGAAALGIEDPSGAAAVGAAVAGMGLGGAPAGTEADAVLHPNAWLVRKEPVEGFMSTYEAICRTVAALESGVHVCAPGSTAPPAVTSQQQQQQQQAGAACSSSGSGNELVRAEQEAALTAQLLAPLRLMVQHQAQFDPCTRDRAAGKIEAASEWAAARGRTQLRY